MLVAEPATTPSSLAWSAALIAWILAVPLFFVTRFVYVIAHEGGHAFVGAALLAGIRRITFERDGSGATEFTSNPAWPFAIFVAFAGYAGPSLFGLMAAWLLLRDRADLVVWGSMAFLVIMLLVVRGWIGWIIVPLLLTGLYRVATKAEPRQLTLFAHVWTWFLLIVAVQTMLAYLSTKTYRVDGSDTRVLQRMTWLPSELWALVHLVATVAALVWGGAMLLRLSG